MIRTKEFAIRDGTGVNIPSDIIGTDHFVMVLEILCIDHFPPSFLISDLPSVCKYFEIIFCDEFGVLWSCPR